MLTNTLEIGIGSNLYQAGYTEDGHPFTAECYFIVATDVDGNRWTHTHTFAGARTECDEEGMDHHIDVREEAMGRAEALLARIAAADEINIDRWVTADPAYGSRAYQDYGQFDQVARERAQG